MTERRRTLLALTVLWVTALCGFCRAEANVLPPQHDNDPSSTSQSSLMKRLLDSEVFQQHLLAQPVNKPRLEQRTLKMMSKKKKKSGKGQKVAVKRNVPCVPLANAPKPTRKKKPRVNSKSMSSKSKGRSSKSMKSKSKGKGMMMKRRTLVRRRLVLDQNDDDDYDDEIMWHEFGMPMDDPHRSITRERTLKMMKSNMMMMMKKKKKSNMMMMMKKKKPAYARPYGKGYHPSPTVFCEPEPLQIRLTWANTTSGLVADGGWTISDDGLTLRFDVEDSFDDCGAVNGNPQSGTATATLVLTQDVVLTAVMDGLGEPFASGLEFMTVTVDGQVIGLGENMEIRNPLTCDAVPIRVQQRPTELSPGTYTLEVFFTTTDENFHSGVFFETRLEFVPV